MFHIVFGFNFPSGFRGEDLWNCGRTDGRMNDRRTPDHGPPISSPCEPNGSGELKKKGGGGRVTQTRTASIWEYPPPPGSDQDVYSLSRISQQYQAWNIKGSDIEAVLMTKDPKGSKQPNSCKCLPLA